MATIQAEDVKIKHPLVISLSIILTVAACGYTEATYFRQFRATQEDERTAWGLCGGNFLTNGQVHPSVEPSVVRCMRSRGFVTLNEYYIEDHIGFIKVRDPMDKFNVKSDLEGCGVTVPTQPVCEIFPYVFREQVPKVAACMAGKGYTPSLPRYKQGVRIFETGADVPSLFCLQLSPKNQLGGISLGKHRIE